MSSPSNSSLLRKSIAQKDQVIRDLNQRIEQLESLLEFHNIDDSNVICGGDCGDECAADDICGSCQTCETANLCRDCCELVGGALFCRDCADDAKCQCDKCDGVEVSADLLTEHPQHGMLCRDCSTPESIAQFNATALILGTSKPSGNSLHQAIATAVKTQSG